jgi:hypothetical protein
MRHSKELASSGIGGVLLRPMPPTLGIATFKQTTAIALGPATVRKTVYRFVALEIKWFNLFDSLIH